MAGRKRNRTKGCSVTMHDTQCVAPTRYSIVRFEGVVLLLALLLLCTHSWGVCNSSGYTVRISPAYSISCYHGPTCSSDKRKCSEALPQCTTEGCSAIYKSGSKYYSGLASSPNSPCVSNSSSCTSTNPYASCWYQYECTTQAEADSIKCVFNPNADGCKVSDPSECTTAECCMEFNQGNVPVDSGFVGCEPPADGSDACAVSGSSAVCNGVSVYSLCTQQYLWNKQLKQCAPVSTNNCIEVRKTDEMCTDVECNSFTETQVVGMRFNPSSRCYEGKYREITHMECSNGVRGQAHEGALQDYVVCDSYLDSLGVSITESTGVPTTVTVTDYISGQYPGGESVDAEGNTVTNSPGGQTGGTSTTQQQVVTRDSSGQTVIVKASDGSDSTALVTSFSQVRCLGCSNGYCTLSNGSTSWSCEANSCSAALMSYNMNGGVCSANYNDYYNQPQGQNNDLFRGDTAAKIALTDSVIDYTSQLNRINKNLEDFMLGNGSPYGFFSQMEAMQAVIMNTSAEQLKSDTALTRIITVKMDSMQSAIDLALGLHAGRMEDALGSASSQISGLFGEQNGIITSASSQASASIVAAIHGTTSAVNSASSQNLVVMQNLLSLVGENNNLVDSVDSKFGTLLGQVSQANETRFNFYAYMHDSLQNALESTISDALVYNSDNIIVPAIESQTEAIVQALGEVEVDFNDSVFYQIKFTVDSLREDLRGYFMPEDIDDTGSTVYDGVMSDTAGSGWLSSVDSFMEASMSDSSFQGVFPDLDTVPDTAWIPDADSLYSVLQHDVDSSRSAVGQELENAFDTLKDEIMLINFDSAIIAPLGVRVPNTNTCPAHCFTYSIDGQAGGAGQSWLGHVGTIDLGLCRPLPGFSFDVFILIRLIARVLVGLSCVYIGIWFISGRKI